VSLPRAHPVLVAAQRVYLTVVGEQSERLCQTPVRKGVRAVALVNQRQRRDDPVVGQIDPSNPGTSEAARMGNRRVVLEVELGR
jgi:hypothetical protein